MENTLARIFALVPGDTIRREDFEAHVIPTTDAGAAVLPLLKRTNFNLRKELEAVERQLIEQALHEAGGVKERAAKLLGLASRQALAHRIRASISLRRRATAFWPRCRRPSKKR